MNPWTFYDFLDSRGHNLIRMWLDSLPAKAAAKIDVRILYMQTIRLWPEKFARALRGWPDLLELRVVFAGSQYRPLGFYGPYPNAFTLVYGAIEKGKLPRRVLEVADENRKIVLTDRSRIRGHEFKRGFAPELLRQ
jgi:hypothetical protein